MARGWLRRQQQQAASDQLPCMIPFSVTVTEAAAPHTGLAFKFWGAGPFIFLPMLLYNRDQLSRLQRQGGHDVAALERTQRCALSPVAGTRAGCLVSGKFRSATSTGATLNERIAFRSLQLPRPIPRDKTVLPKCHLVERSRGATLESSGRGATAQHAGVHLSSASRSEGCSMEDSL